jgi:hypothetical protein
MKKLILLITLFNIVFAQNGTTLQILQKGKTKQIILKSNSTRSLPNSFVTYNGYRFNNSSNILIKFGKIPSSVKSFESRYNLRFINIMPIGYFVFENSSKSNIVDKIQSIIDDQSQSSEYKIDTIKPSWSFNNIKY